MILSPCRHTSLKCLYRKPSCIPSFDLVESPWLGDLLGRRSLCPHIGGSVRLFRVGPGPLIDFQADMSQNKVFSCLKSSFLGAKVSLVKWATDNREDNDAWPWGFLSP